MCFFCSFVLQQLLIKFWEENPHEAYKVLADLIQLCFAICHLCVRRGSGNFPVSISLHNLGKTECWFSDQDSYFIMSPCVPALIKLAGVTLNRRR